MDVDRLDNLARSVVAAGSRRTLLGLLTALPVGGGVMVFLNPDEVEAKDRRRRRKQRHKRSKNPGSRKKHRHKKCKADSVAQTCAGKCGTITNNCNKPVDCGSCACDPACDACFTCQDGGPTTPGTCVVDAAQQGQSCGDSGQVCQANGTCACDAASCASPNTCGGGGAPGVCGCTPESDATTCADKCGPIENNCGQPVDCTPFCSGCCMGSFCQAGDEDFFCGSGGAECDLCVSPQTCGGGGTSKQCGCTPLTACPAGMNCGMIGDGCGGNVDCGTCAFAGEVCGAGGANVCGNPQGTCAAGADTCTQTGDYVSCNGNRGCVCLTTADNSTACVDFTGRVLECGSCSPSSPSCPEGMVCTGVGGFNCMVGCAEGQYACQPACPPA